MALHWVSEEPETEFRPESSFLLNKPSQSGLLFRFTVEHLLHISTVIRLAALEATPRFAPEALDNYSVPCGLTSCPSVSHRLAGMEFYPTELTSPPVPLVALIGKQELHLSIGDFLRTQNVPRVHSIGIQDAHSAAGTFGEGRRLPPPLPPPAVAAAWCGRQRSRVILAHPDAWCAQASRRWRAAAAARQQASLRQAGCGNTEPLARQWRQCLWTARLVRATRCLAPARHLSAHWLCGRQLDVLCALVRIKLVWLRQPAAHSFDALPRVQLLATPLPGPG
jgi:hypothetical protein